MQICVHAASGPHSSRVHGTTISCSRCTVNRTPAAESKCVRNESCRPPGVLCTSTTHHLSSNLMQLRTISTDILSPGHMDVRQRLDYIVGCCVLYTTHHIDSEPSRLCRAIAARTRAQSPSRPLRCRRASPELRRPSRRCAQWAPERPSGRADRSVRRWSTKSAVHRRRHWCGVHPRNPQHRDRSPRIAWPADGCVAHAPSKSVF